MQPYVVSEILGPEGEVDRTYRPVCSRQVLNPKPARPCGR